jgi:hypothetical protein
LLINAGKEVCPPDPSYPDIVADKCREGGLPARPVLPGTPELGPRELVKLFVLGKNHDEIY